MNLAKFLKNKGVLYAVILAIFYQTAMVGLYIYGYHVLPGGVDELSVNVVNLDGSQGEAIQQELTANLPFKKITTGQSLEQSKEALDNRSIQMVIVIPQNFFSNLACGKSEFDFYINQSNTMTTTTTMTAVAQSITDNFNKAIGQKKLAEILGSMNVNSEQQQAITAQLQNSVVQKNVYTHTAPQSMDYIMAPSFLSIGTYASSMVVAIVLMNIFLAFIPIVGKRKAFLYIEAAGCVISVLTPLFGIIMARILISVSLQKLLILYLQQVFMQITAFQFTLVFSLLLGQNGIFINIFLMLAQTIAGGGTMPLQMMPDLFKTISCITPMYPNTQIDFGLMYGGPISDYELRLVTILVISSLALLFIIWRKWPQQVNDNQPKTNKAIIQSTAE
ncbi:YhgE/Pip domain-containing protein [Paenibacillus sp. CGMCC 1.18879]|uniref:YhgE/Pip domain-containing protein n=1 Tax=Paenibacillus sp. CGMCC 1.18879 TaxID=2834466 RepID=UPI001CA8F913|nr:ABC transporter permease [Paenibacillus sp. CGMCC 1.18879]MBY9081804.1 ABC transporter permease [Paenibacillus sp. CGMCC 1.18879]